MIDKTVIQDFNNNLRRLYLSSLVNGTINTILKPKIAFTFIIFAVGQTVLWSNYRDMYRVVFYIKSTVYMHFQSRMKTSLDAIVFSLKLKTFYRFF